MRNKAREEGRRERKREREKERIACIAPASPMLIEILSIF